MLNTSKLQDASQRYIGLAADNPHFCTAPVKKDVHTTLLC